MVASSRRPWEDLTIASTTLLCWFTKPRNNGHDTECQSNKGLSSRGRHDVRATRAYLGFGPFRARRDYTWPTWPRGVRCSCALEGPQQLHLFSIERASQRSGPPTRSVRVPFNQGTPKQGKRRERDPRWRGGFLADGAALGSALFWRSKDISRVPRSEGAGSLLSLLFP